MARKRCGVRGCKREEFCRGMCSPCYQAARRKIRQGQTTEAELEAAGVLLPPRPTRTSAFSEAFRKLDD